MSSNELDRDQIESGRLGLIARDYNLLSAAVLVADEECLQQGGLPLNRRRVQPQRYPPSGNVAGILGIFNSMTEARVNGYLSEKEPVPSESSTSYSGPLFDKLEYGGGGTEVMYSAPGGVQLTVSRGGCFETSISSVYGNLRNYLIWSSVRNVLGTQTSLSPSDLRRIFEPYARCMDAAGVRVGSPGEARALAAERFSKSNQVQVPAQGVERQFVEQDARCQIEAQLTQQLDRRWVDLNRAWVSKNGAYIRSVDKVRVQALRRAEQIVKNQ